MFPENRSNTIKDHALTYSPKGWHTKACSRANYLSLLCHKEPGLIPESLIISVLLKSKHKGTLTEDGLV